MLVLTQMAVGLFTTAAVVGFASAEQFRAAGFPLAASAFALLNAGLFAAVFHLGRPLGAWRFFLGLRTSWMSREILAFSIMATVAAPAVGAAFLFPGSPLALSLTVAAALLGLVSVFTSAMIYVDTRRALWSAAQCFGRFYGATFLLGATAAAVVLGCADRLLPIDLARAVCAAAVTATAIRTALFGWELSSFLLTLRNTAAPAHLSARTVHQLLPWLVPGRLGLFAASTTFSALAIFDVSHLALPWAGIAFVTTFTSQILERFIFFAAVRAPKMPGGI
jgi:DMSO reductase anchor subunit